MSCLLDHLRRTENKNKNKNRNDPWHFLVRLLWLKVPYTGELFCERGSRVQWKAGKPESLGVTRFISCPALLLSVSTLKPSHFASIYSSFRLSIFPSSLLLLFLFFLASSSLFHPHSLLLSQLIIFTLHFPADTITPFV